MLSLTKNGSQHSLKIYDIENEKQLWSGKIKNEELIGRMKSSIYQLVDGHMFYSNNCVKVRYDLLRRNDIQELTEDEVFDYY